MSGLGSRGTRRKRQRARQEVLQAPYSELSLGGKVKKYLLNAALILDISVATIFLAGDPRETISSRLGKSKRSLGIARGELFPWSHPVKRIVDWGLQKIDYGHSWDAITDEFGEGAVRTQ